MSVTIFPTNGIFKSIGHVISLIKSLSIKMFSGKQHLTNYSFILKCLIHINF